MWADWQLNEALDRMDLDARPSINNGLPVTTGGSPAISLVLRESDHAFMYVNVLPTNSVTRF